MALPRLIIPGRTYLFTRRCSERRFFLKPSSIVEQAYTYSLGVAAERFAVDVHAFIVLSNHHHVLLTDPHGELPRFAHALHRSIACALNAFYRRSEVFWSPGSYSAVHLVEAEDVLDKGAYLLANAVPAGLVPRGVEWPGLISRPEDLLEGDVPGLGRRVYSAQRPGVFFAADSDLPERTEFRLTVPPALADRPREEVVAELAARRDEKESEARLARRIAGKGFLGRKAILAQAPFDRPREESGDDGPRREERGRGRQREGERERGRERERISPAVACRDRWRRVETLQVLSQFRVRYRECYVAFRNGDRSVVFPEGTWGPVVLYGARAEGWPRPGWPRPRVA